MKTQKTLTSLLFWIVSMGAAFSQTPGGFSYQAIVRDANNSPITNQDVSLQISIVESTATGTIVYTETHDATTNSFGLVDLVLGSGSATLGSFSEIDWSAGAKFIQIGLDDTGGSDYTIVGSKELLAVPFALHAASGGGQTLTKAGTTITLSNNGGSIEDAVDDADADATNEIQDLKLESNVLTITRNADATAIDLSPYLGGGTQLTEEQVDEFVSDNGYLTSFTEADGDATNEIQDLTLVDDLLSISGNTNAAQIDLSIYKDNTDTQLTEDQVDAFTANNGYLTSFTESDGDVTNEIQDLELTGNTLSITGNDDATSIDLSAYLDDTQLTEEEVDDFVSDNGYLTSFTEVDGDATNEIQDLSLTGDNLTITNNSSATNIDLSTYRDNTDAQTLTLTGSDLAVSGGNSVDLSSLTSNSVLLTGVQSIAGEKTFSDLAKFSTIGSSGTTNEVATDAGIAVIDGNLCPSPIPTTEGQEGCFRMSDDPNSSTSPTFPTTGDVVRINSKDFTITRTQRGGFFFYNRGADGNVVDYTGADLGAAASIITAGTLGDVVIHGKMKLTDGSTTLTFPSTDGTSGQVLATDGSGNITFQDAATDTKLTEAEVDAFANNNGYLTTEVDGSITNEIQDLSLIGDNLSITNNSAATNIDLSGYKDNTDAQTLSLSGTNLSVSGGNSVDLDPVINNSVQLSGDQTATGVKTFSDGVKLTSISSSGASSASTTPLAMVIQTVSRVPQNTGEEGIFTLAADPNSSDTPISPSVGEVVRVNGKDFEITRSYRGGGLGYFRQANGLVIEAADVDATVVRVDAASLGNILVTGTLQLTNGASTITLPNADGSAGQVLSTDGSGNVTFQDAAVDTKLTESEVDAFANNNGYLTSFTEADGDATNEIQDLNLSGDDLTITNNTSATTIDLSSYKDNTDAQTLSLTGSQLSISGGNNVNLPEELPASLGTSGQVLAVNSTEDGVEWTTASAGGSGVFTQSGNTISAGGATDDLVFGSTSLDDISGTDDDNRLFYDKSKGSFRAGSVTGTDWDESNIGNYSTAFGQGTTASGNSSTALGTNTNASGQNALAAGIGSGASGFASTAFGLGTSASGSGATSFGSLTSAIGASSFASGTETRAVSQNEFAIGTYNTNYTPSNDNTDRAFVIGNGTVLSQSDAFTVYKNGALGLFDFSTAPATTTNRLYSVNGALHYNGSAVGGAGGGSSTNFVTETNSTHTIPSGQSDYFLNFSTIDESATVTFPASPTAGDKVTIAFRGNSGSRNIDVANTHTGSFTLNSETYSSGQLNIAAGGSGSIQLVYNGSTWIQLNGGIASWIGL